MLKRFLLPIAWVLTLPLLSGCANRSAAADEAVARSARDPLTLRVMTYNIHIGKGMDGKTNLGRVANVINAADVDVVALQEVDVRTRRSGVESNQLTELSAMTGMYGVFAKVRDFDGGQYGQAVLSRRPIAEMKVHKLLGDAAGPQEQIEERIAVVTTIPQDGPLPDLLFVGTHLHHVGESHRLKQSAEVNRVLADHIAKREPAVILLGDLNATPDSQVMKRMRETWDDPTADAGMTFPADKPDRKIDYVLLPKGHGWKVVSARVVDEPVASDHRPVVVELRLKE
jgi:endonuclease/exonuclease/phosphatase family metal-dependent hydrolase